MRQVYFQVLLFHICTYEMKYMKFFSLNSYKSALFRISKLLGKGIARMDSDTCGFTYNRSYVSEGCGVVPFSQLHVVTCIYDG
jgi:hypothetical protein